MSQSGYKEQVIEQERKLLAAFTNKDLDVLDKLIHDDCLFVLPNGKSINKADVINNYRGGDISMTTATSTDQIINIIDNTAVVSFNLELKGKHHDELIHSQFRYIRVWKLIDDEWKAVATAGAKS